MPRYRAAVFLTCLLWLTAARAEDIQVTVPWKGQQIQIRARLFHPAGPGPFAGVILMHGCDGLNGIASIAFYTSMLVQQGYAVAARDSLTARHIVEDCNRGAVQPRDSAPDVFALAEPMATRPDIKARKIGVAGWSYGGRADMYIVRDWPDERPLRDSLAAKGAKIAAVVSLYGSGCTDAANAAVVVPLLGLFGDINTRIDNRQALAAQSNGLMQVHVNASDFHAFDTPVSGDDPTRPHSPRGVRAIMAYYQWRHRIPTRACFSRSI